MYEIIPNLYLCTPTDVPPTFDALVFCTNNGKIFETQLTPNILIVRTYASDVNTSNIILHSFFPESNVFIHNFRQQKKKVYIASKSPSAMRALAIAYLMQSMYLTQRESTILLSEMHFNSAKTDLDFSPALNRWAVTLTGLSNMFQTNQNSEDFCEGERCDYEDRDEAQSALDISSCTAYTRRS